MRSAFAFLTVLATLWSAPSFAEEFAVKFDISPVHAPTGSFPYDHLRFSVDVCGTFLGSAPSPITAGKIVRMGAWRPILVADQVTLFLPRDSMGHDFCTTVTDLAPEAPGGPSFFIVYYRAQFGKMVFPFALLLKINDYIPHPVGRDIDLVDKDKLSLALARGIVVTDPRTISPMHPH